MPFQHSSLRIAGQDSDTVDMFFSPFEASKCLPVSPIPGKQMYGTNESILSWINAIDCVSIIASLPLVAVDRVAGRQVPLESGCF